MDILYRFPAYKLSELCNCKVPSIKTLLNRPPVLFDRDCTMIVGHTKESLTWIFFVFHGHCLSTNLHVLISQTRRYWNY